MGVKLINGNFYQITCPKCGQVFDEVSASVSCYFSGDRWVETQSPTSVQGVWAGVKCPKCGAITPKQYLLYDASQAKA